MESRIFLFEERFDFFKKYGKRLNAMILYNRSNILFLI